MKNQFIDKKLPLFIPHSSTTTAVNKTGSWRFFHPKYEEKTAPCTAACPVGQDIPKIEMLASRGLHKDACRMILDENPFPAVCGRVCFHPCEGACNRAHLDDPIAIHHLERFIGDTAISGQIKPEIDIKPSTDKKIAIAGAGPAGLAAAYFLARLGYGCDVFEAASEPGGLLRWGIPDYRLPRDVIEQEIKRIEDTGVSIHCRTPVTESLLDKLKQEYDALFIGCGYGHSFMLNMEGEQFAVDGLEFLNRLSVGEKISYIGTSAVIGGGNTAIDVARSLARLGAAPLIVYRRRVQDMPAFAPEVDMAIEEGVRIMELVSPIHIRETGGDSFAPPGYELALQKMRVDKIDTGGRARVVPDGDYTEAIEVQNVFVAIGAAAEDLWQLPDLEDAESLQLSHCGFFEKKIPVVYGGDLASPVKSVSDAIASGKQAALALDVFFQHGIDAVQNRLGRCRVGDGPALSMNAYLENDRRNRSPHIVTYDEIVTDYFSPAARAVPVSLEADSRIRSFTEIESTFDNTTAGEEAARCFNCGICAACDYCRLYCPEMAVLVEKGQRSINMDFCKGCGVCATECPRNAMALEEEVK